MNNINNNLDCEIVRDLLTLYNVNDVSETTHSAVENHLRDCAECSKEYDSLFRTITQYEDASTKDSFIKMMRRKKRKQRFVTALVALICCSVVALTYYVLTEVPLVEVKDVQVHKVYLYEGESADKFFVMYSHVFRSGERWNEDITEKDGKTVVTHTLKRPVISEEFFGEVECVAFGAENADELNYGGQTVWVKAENGKDEIPSYVYAFEEFENGNLDEFGDSDSVLWVTGVEANDVNDPSNYLGIQYPDSRVVKWNLDGDVIYDSAESEK